MTRGDFNDRLLLGHERRNSREAELHFIRARLRGGHAVQGPPRRADHAVARRPGLRRRRACHPRPRHRHPRPSHTCSPPSRPPGRRTACVKAFHAAGLLFPWRHRKGPRKGELDWTAAAHSRRAAGPAQPPLRRRASPTAGTATSALPGGTATTSASSLPREEWISFIPGAHPGYITLEQYDANLARLAANAAAHGRDRPQRAAPRRTRAAPRHHHLRPLRAADDRPLPPPRRPADPHLHLPARQHRERAGPSARRSPGGSLDQAHRRSCSSTPSPRWPSKPRSPVSAELEHRAAEAGALRAAHVERARYLADLARRRYLAVDPANRLVAGTLEADWNTALRALHRRPGNL